MKNAKESKLNDIGACGENLAEIYLINNGYKIIARNFRTKYGEIDIIAIDKQRTLVFVEVKTLAGCRDPICGLMPEDNLSRWKLYKIQRICNFYANANFELVGDNGWRIDLLAITIKSNKATSLRHYKNL